MSSDVIQFGPHLARSRILAAAKPPHVLRLRRERAQLAVRAGLYPEDTVREALKQAEAELREAEAQS